VFFISVTWYLYPPDENMKKLTEARDGKELSGVDSSKRSFGPYKVPQPPPPHSHGRPGPNPLP